jgi:tellurite resistance protein TerC
MQVSIFFWIGFHIFIFLMLALDLGILNKKAHKIPVKEALMWSSVWITLAMLFFIFIFFEFGKTRALEFLTGYVIEYSLSVDNIFVFILVFSYFAVNEEYQHRILFWGIIGALVMRGLFIFAGVALIHRFHWIVIIFGGFLVFTGLKMLLQKQTRIYPGKNPVMKVFRKLMPVSDEPHGGRLILRQDHRTYVTPLFLVLLVIESSDLIFAVDSIPAVLAISKETFIVYTSNIFAILGLRSLYFAVAGIMRYFIYIKKGLSIILTFVGLKMLGSFFSFEIPVVLSLSIIVTILLVTIIASIINNKKK